MFKLFVVLLAVGYASASPSATSATPPGVTYPPIPAQYANKCVLIEYNGNMSQIAKVTQCPTITSTQQKNCQTSVSNPTGSYPHCCEVIKGTCSAAAPAASASS